jgi:hypothetical protein
MSAKSVTAVSFFSALVGQQSTRRCECQALAVPRGPADFPKADSPTQSFGSNPRSLAWFPGNRCGLLSTAASNKGQILSAATEQLPPNNRIRLNDDQRFLPALPRSGKPDPEHPIRSSQAPVGVSPSQNGKLLPQRQVFKGQFASIPENGSECGDHAKESFHHGCRGCHLEIKTSMLPMRMGSWQMRGARSLPSFAPQPAARNQFPGAL